MNLRQTHTFAVMEVSESAFKEIEHLLEQAGYDHVFIEDDDGRKIDMHGIALKSKKGATGPILVQNIDQTSE